MNFVAFDFGMKNIGIAVGQNITYTVSPLFSIKAKYGVPNFLHLKKVFEEWIPKKAIVGLPLSMDGGYQNITLMAKNFGYKLQKYFKVNVEMYDERLSTRESYSILSNGNIFKKIKKSSIDAVSASIILESWMYNNLKK